MSPAGVPTVVLAVRRFLDGPDGPPAGSHGLIAVSGGADSTALAVALAALAPARRLELTVGHVDHGLRPTSADDVERVRALAGTLGLAFRSASVTIDPARAVEVTARRRRYGALARIADTIGAHWTAVGHTRDDQVETMLMRLARGAGRGGLGGMRPRRGRILRPLLEATRADVRWYLGDCGIAPSEDPSNADLRFARNRVRHLVVPLLERELSPRLGERLASLGARLRDEDDLLAKLAAERAAALGVGERLPRAVAAESPALARRIVRAWLDATWAPTVGSRHVEAVLALARRAGGRSTRLPGAGRVVRVGDELRHEAEAADVSPFETPVRLGDVLEGPPGCPWRLGFSECMPRGPSTTPPPDTSAFVADADRLPGPITVRSPRPGDRMRITGVGTRKLQDVLVDRRVPRGIRHRLPVVTAGDEVLWLPGVARSDVARLGPDTLRVVEGRLLDGEVFGLPVKNRCGSLDAETRVPPARRR